MGLLELVRRLPQTYNRPMRKTFGSAFALIMVALFTVAPTSPATAYPGGIHLHIAGKVGQKAVVSTVIFGAEGLTEAPQKGSGLVPNACLWLWQANKYGELGYPLEPAISGWGHCEGLLSTSGSGKQIQIPASGSAADQIPLPDLPAGKYELWFASLPSTTESSISLGVAFTIGADGTFTAIGPACRGIILAGGLCMPERNIVIE